MPTLDNALNNLIDWEKFAIHLCNMEIQEVEEIKKEKHKLVDQKIELYGRWLRRCPSSSWSDVVKALKRAKEYTLATNIEDKYINSLSPYTSDSYSTPPRKQADYSSGSIQRHDIYSSLEYGYRRRRGHKDTRRLRDYHYTLVSGPTTPNASACSSTNEMSIGNIQHHYSIEDIKELEITLSQEIYDHSQTKARNITLVRKRRRLFNEANQKFEAEMIKTKKEKDDVVERCMCLEHDNEQLRKEIETKDEAMRKKSDEYKNLIKTCNALTTLTTRLTTENQSLQDKQATLKQQLNDLINGIQKQREEDTKRLKHMTSQL